mgnify:CR=1 FL=1
MVTPIPEINKDVRVIISMMVLCNANVIYRV